jgi:hypothetical protein
MIIVPTIPSHLIGLSLTKWQIGVMDYLNDDYAEILLSGESQTAIVNGQVIAIAGVLQLTFNRWQAWALMTEKSGKYMLQCTRAIDDFLDKFEGERIETPVRHDFKAGHRWAKMLGFKNETPNGMIKYDNGETYDLYARVK